MKIYYIKYNILLLVILTLILIISLSLYYYHTEYYNNIKTFKDENVLYKGNIEKNTIAIACNVDWGNENIPSMLEIFRKNNIKITFFVTGRWAEKYSDLLKEIHNNGHEIGNHGFFHKDYSLLNYEMNKEEILKTDKIINNILDIKPEYFAPPAGAYNKDTLKAAKDLNYKVILWSIDTIDWRTDSTKDKIINRVIENSHNSAIVLLHPKSETIKALPIIIEKLQQNGYEIGKISDIIK